MQIQTCNQVYLGRPFVIIIIIIIIIMHEYD